jgi:hypothetical protein
VYRRPVRSAVRSIRQEQEQGLVFRSLVCIAMRSGRRPKEQNATAHCMATARGLQAVLPPHTTQPHHRRQEIRMSVRGDWLG